MIELATVRTFLSYSDWANGRLLAASAELPGEHLDRAFDMGRGSLRRTLLHVWAGEDVWLARWQGRTETAWPDENEAVAVATLAERFRATWSRRDEFLTTLRSGAAETERLVRQLVYRDSKGGLFTAALWQMMLQMCLHSMHHRAQAVNMLRRVGAEPPEVDYMMRVRQPV